VATKRRKKNQDKLEFSKILLIQESVLIWIMTIYFMYLAYLCIVNQYFGELPWLAAMVGFPWTAYGVSQMYYYKKSMKENSKDGIKYEAVMADIANGYPSEDACG
jgi:hypothetical protein